jgi:phospholipase A1
MNNRCLNCVLLSTVIYVLTANAYATVVERELQVCFDMPDSVPENITLECYKQLKQAQITRNSNKKITLVTVQNRGLADEWTPPDAPFSVYKSNYLLFYSYSSQPNSTPTSSDRQSQVPYAYTLDNRDVKFQISLKAHLLGINRHALWLGYTQLSFWQIYDTKHSSPFRESNYEPEIIYSFRPESLKVGPLVSASFINAGLVHASNGQSLPRSRGWSRIYIQAGLERDFGVNGRLALLPRIWKRLEWGNPDIAHYLGNGDVELRYCYGQGVYAIIARPHSIQLDLAFPMPRIFGIQLLNSNLHLQYFDGYGESLIDYNQSHRTLGWGISVPLE